MLSDQDPAELDLIRVIIATYHTTRLSEVSAEAHILSKPSVRKSLDRYREEGRQSAGDRQMETDARRFRALMRCGRISMQGSSGVDPHTGERNGNNIHFGAEFWPEPAGPEFAEHYAKSTAWGRACLRHLADAILEHEAALLSPQAAPAEQAGKPPLSEKDMALLDALEAMTTLCEWFGQREQGQPTANSEVRLFERVSNLSARLEVLYGLSALANEQKDGAS